MSVEGRKWLRENRDVQATLGEFAERRGNERIQLALEELRKPSPSLSQAAAHAAAAEVYDQLLNQLQLFLQEDQP